MGLRIVTIAVLFVIPFAKGLKAHDSCSDVKTFYDRKGFSQLVLNTAKVNQKLNVCGGDVSCCTTHTEDRLSILSMDHIQSAVSNKTSILANLLLKKHERFDKFFRELIESAGKSLDFLFEETYGDLYTNNAKVFKKFFEDLKQYYEGDILDLSDIFDGFFTTLMQRVFKLLNPSYDIDDEYMQCMGDNLNVIQPFADLPLKLSNQVQRSFIAARTFVQALKTGEQVSTQLGKIYPTTTCIKNYIKTMHCSKCSGFVDVKPCKNTCEKVLGECFCSFRDDVNSIWNKYLDGMINVLIRLEGPFDIESVLSPIDVKISEGIMMLQENKRAITNAVFQQCGELSENTNVSLYSGLGLGRIDLSGLSIDMSENSKSSSNPLAGLDLSGLDGRLPKNSKSSHGARSSLADLDLSGLSRYLSKRLKTGDSSFGLKGLEGLDFDEVDDSMRRTKRSLKPLKNDDKRKERKKNRRRKRKHKRRHRVRDVSGSKKKELQRKIMKKPNRHTRLRDLVGEMRLARNDLKNFWRDLPDQLCNDEAESTAENSCWDGAEKRTYMPKNDPHKPRCGNVSHFVNAATKQQVVILREITSKLSHARNGVDPTFLDREAPGDFSGEGSGDEGENPAVETDGETEEVVTQPTKDKFDKKHQLIKHLKEWQIELIEHALGKPVDKQAKLDDVKMPLLAHPHLQVNKTISKSPKDFHYGNLTKTQQRQLKKILGFSHEPSVRKDPDPSKGSTSTKEPVATQRPRGVETTSGSLRVKVSSAPLLVITLLLQLVRMIA